MTASQANPDPQADRTPGEPGSALAPAARRALDEARARRAAQVAALPPEIDGRGGLEPVRYGDWEVKGIASDF